MRSLLVALIVICSLPLIFRRPYVGIIMWFWVSLMNPHKMAYGGLASAIHPAELIGVSTIVAWVLSQESKRLPIGFLTVSLAAFAVWISITVPFAHSPDLATDQWLAIIKMLGMSFLTACIVNSRERVNGLVWIFIISIGFFGVKGGIFTVLTGGNFRVWGPPGTMIEDNNGLAIALIMVLPLINYLRLQSVNPAVRTALSCAMGLVIISVCGSYSRAAFLGLVPGVLYLWLKSRKKIMTALVAGGVCAAALSFMPDKYWDRINTIVHYQNEGSALDRLQTWAYGWRLTLDHPIFGAGFNVWQDRSLYAKYFPSAADQFAAGFNFHNIYMQVLVETGFVGLVIFILVLIACFLTARRVNSLARGNPDLSWARDLAAMTQVSLLGYAIAGTFHNMAYYDLYYALCAMLICLERVVSQSLSQKAVKPATTARAEVLSVSGAVLGGGHQHAQS